jgi:hypothetical protein
VLWHGQQANLLRSVSSLLRFLLGTMSKEDNGLFVLLAKS